MHSELITTIMVLLLLTVVAIFLFRTIALPAIVAYLGVGILTGPNGLGLVDDSETIQLIAEFGVVFLLFTLGLEFSLPRLAAMRKAVLGMGGAQMLLTSAAVGGLVWVAGFPPSLAFVLAGVAAVSSTAVVIKQMAEQMELSSRHGNNAVGILLFQDLAVIPFLIIIPLLGATASMHSSEIALEILTTLGIGAVATVLLFLSGRWMLRPLYHRIAATNLDELFTIGTLLVVLLFAWVTEMAGLSYELGAFLAGLALSETRFRQQIEDNIRPFRDVLLGFFFITIGMLLNLVALPDIIGWVLLLLFSLILVKFLVILLIARLLGETSDSSIRTGIVLAQGGEFGFVMLALVPAGLMDPQQMQMVLATVIFSILLTPLLVRYNQGIARALLRVTGLAGATAGEALTGEARREQQRLEAIAAATSDYHDHVILCGYGASGETIGTLIEEEGARYLALDRDAEIVKHATAQGLPVFLGSGTLKDVLLAAGIERARVMVVAHDDTSAAIKTIRVARSLAHKLNIIVRTRDESAIGDLFEAGASDVIPMELEATLVLAGYILTAYGVPIERFMHQTAQIREEHYRRLERSVSDVPHGVPEGKAVDHGLFRRRVVIRRDDWAEGRTLRELVDGLRPLEIVALDRAGIRGEAPERETRLRVGDALLVFGREQPLDELKQRIRQGPWPAE